MRVVRLQIPGSELQSVVCMFVWEDFERSREKDRGEMVDLSSSRQMMRGYYGSSCQMQKNFEKDGERDRTIKKSRG